MHIEKMRRFISQRKRKKTRGETHNKESRYVEEVFNISKFLSSLALYSILNVSKNKRQ